MNTFFIPLTIYTIVSTGLIAGLFFIFSFSVMDALEQMPALQGMQAMQLINRTILNPVFLFVFISSALACLLLIGLTVWQRTPGYEWLIAGALVYLIGGFGVTALFNVPLNNALDVLTPGGSKNADIWAHYLVRWTQWNTFRTAMSVVAVVLLSVGLCG